MSKSSRAKIRDVRIFDNGATGNFVGVDQLRVAIPGSVRKLPHPVPVKMGANVRMTNQSMLTAAVFPGSQQP